jgi:hypothetical protein
MTSSQRPTPSRWPGPITQLLVWVLSGTIAFLATGATYRAVGTIRFREPPMPAVLGTASPDPFDVASPQAALIRSRRVIDFAMAGPNWSKTWPTSPDAVLANLSSQATSSLQLEVEYLAADPAAAEGQLAGILQAYQQYRDELRADAARQLSLLEAQNVVLTAQLRQAEQRARDAAEADAVRARFVETRRRIDELQREDRLSTILLVFPVPPATIATDHRPRNAAWAALAGLIGFSLLHYLLRWSQSRRSRTAFVLASAPPPGAHATPLRSPVPPRPNPHPHPRRPRTPSRAGPPASRCSSPASSARRPPSTPPSPSTAPSAR